MRPAELRGGELLGLARRAVGLGWRSSRLLAIVAICAQVLGSLAPAAGAWSSKELVDGLGGSASGGHLMFLAAAVVVAGGVGAVLSYAANLANAAQQRAVSLSVESELYSAINAQPGLGYFENPRFQDRLRLAQQSAVSAPSTVFNFFLAAVRTVVTLVSFLGVLLVIWWPAAVLLAVTAAPTVFGQLALTRRQAGVAETNISLHRRRFAYQSLLTNPDAIKEVCLFGLGDLFLGRMNAGLRDTAGRELAVERRTAYTQSLFALLGMASGASGAVIVAWRAANGLATAGDVVLFVAALVGVQAAFTGTITQFGSTVKAIRLFHHFRAIVTQKPDLEPGEQDPGPLTGEIVFADVWFRYDRGETSGASDWVLKGLNLTIPAGTTLGLVGANGAGKSTLIKLLCRFYDPQRGRITWNGVDLRKCSPEALRRRIGATFQDYQTFELTAGENVGVGDLTYLHDQQRIESAVRAAGAERIVAGLPHGYDTMISRIFSHHGDDDAGVALSGGQGQRVSLARSFMRLDADLMILDEPSSGLDAVAESEVNEQLRAYRRGRTNLLVSHRLSAIRNANVIVVLQDGVVAEIGAHDDLMTADGIYASMFSVQASGYQDERVAAQMAVTGTPPAVLKAMASGATVRMMPVGVRPQALMED